jgi:phage gpG-like protein
MLTIQVNADGAQAVLKAAAERAVDLSAPMARIGQRLLADIHRNFREGGWYPELWPKSERARKKGGQTLVDKGLLRRSMQQESGADYAQAGSGLVYARIHQEGGTISIPARVQARRDSGRFMKTAAAGRRKKGAVGITMLPARTIEMPARPFLPVRGSELAPATAEFVRKQLGDYVTGVLG